MLDALKNLTGGSRTKKQAADFEALIGGSMPCSHRTMRRRWGCPTDCGFTARGTRVVTNVKKSRIARPIGISRRPVAAR